MSEHTAIAWTDHIRPIPGFPGYFVTFDGKVIGRRGWRLRPTRTDSGHRLVMLYLDGKPIGRLVHRLVLEAFVGPCPDGMEACHGDGDPDNNRLTNLRWDTRSANQMDSVRHGTKFTPNVRLTHADVEVAKELRAAGHSYRRIAELIGVQSHTTIRSALTGASRVRADG